MAFDKMDNLTDEYNLKRKAWTIQVKLNGFKDSFIYITCYWVTHNETIRQETIEWTNADSEQYQKHVIDA